MPDISLSAGVDTSGVAAGMASIENTVQKTGQTIASHFAGLFSVGVLIAGVERVIAKMAEIHKQAERFDIDAEQFQRVANAAKAVDISSGAVARSMNLMAINAQKALDPSTKQAKALDDLGINAAKFAAAAPWDRVLMLSDAYVTAEDKSAAFVDISEIVGKKNTELIALFEQGRQKIQEYADKFPVLSNAEVAALAEMHVAQERYTANLDNFIAKAVVSWGHLFDSIKAGLANVGIALLKPFGAGDFVEPAYKQAAELAARKKYLQDIMLNPAGKAGGAGAPPVGLEDITAGAAGGLGSGKGGGGNLEALQRSMATAHLAMEEAAAGKSNLEARLALITKEREEGQLAYMAARDRGTSEEELLKMAVDLEKVGTKELQAQDQISQENQKQQDAAAEFNQLEREHTTEIQRQIQASQSRAEIEQAILDGHEELVPLLQTEADFNLKIQEAIDKANAARAKGLELTAQENEKLAEQLIAEKAVALQAAYRAAASAALSKNETIRTEDIRLQEILGRLGSDTARYQSQTINLQTAAQQAYLAGNTILGNILSEQAKQTGYLAAEAQRRETGISVATPGTNFIAGLAKGNLRLGATSDVYAAALAASQGIQPGTPEYERLVQQITAEDQLRRLSGKNLGWGEQLNRDKLVQWFADTQQQKATASADQSHRDEIAFWEAIAAGRSPGDNPFTSLYGNAPFTSGNVIPGQDNNATQIAKLSDQIAIQQQQLNALQQIAANTQIVHV